MTFLPGVNFVFYYLVREISLCTNSFIWINFVVCCGCQVSGFIFVFLENYVMYGTVTWGHFILPFSIIYFSYYGWLACAYSVISASIVFDRKPRLLCTLLEEQEMW